MRTVTSKGQVTIPAEVHRHLRLNQHDKIAFVLEPEGIGRLKSTTFPTIQSLRGIAGSLPRPMGWHEVLETAGEDHLAGNRLGDD